MKKCLKCKNEKDEQEFSLSPKVKDGLNTICKECQSVLKPASYKEYLQKFPEQNIQLLSKSPSLTREEQKNLVGKGLSKEEILEARKRKKQYEKETGISITDEHKKEKVLRRIKKAFYQPIFGHYRKKP